MADSKAKGNLAASVDLKGRGRIPGGDGPDSSGSSPRYGPNSL